MKLTAAFVLMFTCLFLTARFGGAEPVTYDATLKPFGDSLTWDYTIGGGCRPGTQTWNSAPETITASVTGDMSFAQDSKDNYCAQQRRFPQQQGQRHNPRHPPFGLRYPSRVLGRRRGH